MARQSTMVLSLVRVFLCMGIRLMFHSSSLLFVCVLNVNVSLTRPRFSLMQQTIEAKGQTCDLCFTRLRFIHYITAALLGPQRVLGIWGEWLFIFRELGSTGNYFRGAGEQVYCIGDLGSPAKKQNNKGKASILFDF